MLRRNVLALNENMHDRDLTAPVPTDHNKVFVHQRWSAMLAKLRAYWQTGQTGWGLVKNPPLWHTPHRRAFHLIAGHRAGDCGASVY